MKVPRKGEPQSTAELLSLAAAYCCPHLDSRRVRQPPGGRHVRASIQLCLSNTHIHFKTPGRPTSKILRTWRSAKTHEVRALRRRTSEKMFLKPAGTTRPLCPPASCLASVAHLNLRSTSSNCFVVFNTTRKSSREQKLKDFGS